MLGPSVIIAGFDTSYSAQLAEILEQSDSIASIAVHDAPVDEDFIDCSSGKSLHDIDVAVVNHKHPHHVNFLKCLTESDNRTPPASLLIGAEPSGIKYQQAERRKAPRLYLEDDYVTARKLLDSVLSLHSARNLPIIDSHRIPELDDDFIQEDSALFEAYSDSAYQPTDVQPIIDEYGTVRIGDYSLKDQLGSGGIGSVYRASMPGESDVAIKFMDVHLMDDERQLDRFIEEYELLADIDHPNVVKVHELGITDTQIYIVMDLASAGTLKPRIRKGLSTEEALKHAIGICDGLHAVHEAGIVHRDIKPNNILFNGDTPLISDLGAAKNIASKIAMDMTLHGEAIGTPAYMSPEQVMGHDVTTRSDLYALGVMLFRMFTGRLPFEARSPVVMMQKHLDVPPPHLPVELNDLEPIVRRLMCKQPTQRFESAQEVRDALSAFLS